MRPGEDRAVIARTADASAYSVSLAWSKGCTFRKQSDRHSFILSADGAGILELACAFSARETATLPTVSETRAAAAERWKDFWLSGGAIDLSGAEDLDLGDLSLPRRSSPACAPSGLPRRRSASSARQPRPTSGSGKRRSGPGPGGGPWTPPGSRSRSGRSRGSRGSDPPEGLSPPIPPGYPPSMPGPWSGREKEVGADGSI